MTLRSMPQGALVTKAAAAYPGLMNRELAFRLLMAAGMRRASTCATTHLVRAGYWSNPLVHVSTTHDEQTQAVQPHAFEIKVSKVNHARQPKAVLPTCALVLSMDLASH